MSVKFTKSATEITVRGYNFPFRPEFRPNVVKEFTEGGTLLIEDLGGESEVRVLSWDVLTTDERDDLYDFFKTTLSNGVESFTFTDVDATTHTAYWMDDIFDFQMDREGRWSGQITLRFET